MAVIQVSPRPGLFDVVDYQSPGGDDAIAIRAALADAAAHGGGVVQLENRVYNLLSAQANGCALINTPARGFPIKLRGRGRGVTKLKYSSAVSTLVGISDPQDGSTLSIDPFDMEDFTVDGTGRSTANKGYLLFYGLAASGGTTAVTNGRHHIVRVDAQTFGHSNLASGHFAVFWNCNRASISAAQAGATTKWQGLRVTDCDWGHGPGTTTSRGGGLGGVVLGGNISQSSTVDKDSSGRLRPSRMYEAVWTYPGNAANIIVDDIEINGLKHTSGSSVIDRSLAGDPVQLGPDCMVNHVRVKNCYFENSGDIGIELDNVRDALVEGCTFFNIDGNNLLIIPFIGATDNEVGNIVVRDCVGIQPTTDNYGGVTGSATSGFFFSINSRFGGQYKGKILIDNFEGRWERATSTAQTGFSVGPAREVTVRDSRVVIKTDLRASGAQFNGLAIRASGQQMKVNVENYRMDFIGTADGVTLIDWWLAVQDAADLTLNVRGLSGTSIGSQINSGKRSIKAAELSCSVADTADTMTSDQLQSVALFDAGAYTDYTYDGTNHWYTAGANLSTEKRAAYVATLGQTSADNLVGRRKDGSHWSLMKTGSTRDGYKGGAFGKRRDSTSYLEAYVYDDGTTSYLCLDKVDGGTRTSLLTSPGGTATGAVVGGNLVVDSVTSVTGVSDRGLALPSRIGTSTTHYPAITVQGDTVYAELWQSAAPGSVLTMPSGTGDAWCSVTLTGSDVRRFGSRAMGEFGFSQIPITSDAVLGTLHHRRLSVLRGKIDGVYISELDGIAGNTFGVSYQPGTGLANKVRIDGALELVSSDFSNLNQSTGSGTIKDIDMITGATAFTQYFLKRRNKWSTAVTDTAVTFVSGTAWQNQTGCWGTLTIQGGTVTKIEVSKDGTTYRDTGATSGAIRVSPNWYVKVTHTGAPTSYFMAED